MSDQLRTIDGKKILALLSSKFHITQTQELTAEKNGNYEPDDGYDAFSKVTVALPLQEKTIVKNGTYEPDEGCEAFSKVTVALPTQEKTITVNGTYEPESPNIGFSKVTVALPTQEKTITVNGIYEPESPNIGFSKVTVAVPITLAKQIDVEFPGVSTTELIITTIKEVLQDGSETTKYYCDVTSTPKTYTGYKYGNDTFTTTCKINGIAVTTEYTEIDSETVYLIPPKPTGNIVAAKVTRYAEFTNDGVLRLWTKYKVEATTSMFSITEPVETLSQKATMTMS